MMDLMIGKHDDELEEEDEGEEAKCLYYHLVYLERAEYCQHNKAEDYHDTDTHVLDIVPAGGGLGFLLGEQLAFAGFVFYFKL